MFYWSNNNDTVNLNNPSLGGQQQTNFQHSHGHRTFNISQNNNQNRFSNQPAQFLPRNNNHSSKRENGTWECNVCHKIFRQRKGFYQHINSNTHQPIKHSCSLCGKGFASLGALALHNEQASHAHLNNRDDSETADSIDVTISSEFSNSVSAKDTISNAEQRNAYNLKSFPNGPQSNNNLQRRNDQHGTHNTANINKNEFIPDIVNNGNYPNHYASTQVPINVPPPFLSSQSFENLKIPEVHTSSTSFDLVVGGMIDLPSKVGSYGWAIGDISCDKSLFQHAVSFVDCQWTVEQLEYQALIHGLKAVHSKGIKVIQIRECGHATISHLMNETTPKSSDAVKHHELESFKAEVLQLFPLFEQITFEMQYSAGYIESIIKKSISDCIMRLHGSSYTGNNNNGGVDSGNRLSINPQVNMSYSSNQFVQTSPPSVPSNIWSQLSHLLPLTLSANANQFSPSIAGESSFSLNRLGEDVSKMNQSVTSTSSDLSDFSKSIMSSGSYPSFVGQSMNVSTSNNSNNSTATDITNLVPPGLQNYYG